MTFIAKLLLWLVGVARRPSAAAERAVTSPHRLHVPRSLMYKLRNVSQPNVKRVEPLAFLRVRFASEGSRTVLVAIGVLPFPDEAYVEGPAGANFDTEWAVNVANQQIGGNVGLLLVHSHGGTGMPTFSGTDRSTNYSVMGALAVGVETAPYGAVVLSDTHARGVLATPKKLTDVKVIVVPDHLGELPVSA
jgi:hypothetical protein